MDRIVDCKHKKRVAMCYDIQLLKGKLKKLEERYGNVEVGEEAELLPARVFGFASSKLPVLTP